MKLTYRELAITARLKGGRAPAVSVMHFPKDEVLYVLNEATNYGDACIKLGLATRKGTKTRPMHNLRRIADHHGIDIDMYLVSHGRYCYTPTMTLERMAREVLLENVVVHRANLKAWLYYYELKEKKCEECGCTDVWNYKSITLELHHMNGVSNDNRLENLQILCPNCHSQTDTHRSRNIQR